MMKMLVSLLTALALSWSAGADDKAEGKFTFVDLQPKANQKLDDNLHDNAGNNLKNVPRGEQKFGDSRFKIGDKMIHLKGENAADAPEKVEEIKIDALFDNLHILHSTGYGEPDMEEGKEIATYIVHYADKTDEKIPVKYGEDVRDWWVNPDRNKLTNAKVAWTGSNEAASAMDRKVALYAVVWKNPHPEKQVSTIDFVSKNTMCDPFLVALSLEKAEAK